MKKDELVAVLMEGESSVIFDKIDGTQREMKCTLKQALIGQDIPNRGIRESRSPETLSVWDLEARGWRSFRLSNVKSVNGIKMSNGIAI